VEFLKNDSELTAISLQPDVVITPDAKTNANQRALAAIYNRLGGLLERLICKLEVEPSTVAAVWLVESGGLPFTPKRAVIRLEVHQLFELWGKRDRVAFETHFRFGGHNKQPGNPWENQEYRAQDSGNFAAVHHNQNSEYAALTLAQVIASEENAFLCTSIGGCQLMMSNYDSLGYETVRHMYDAFQQSERAHVLSFFDYCQWKAAPKPGDLLGYLRKYDWNSFAKYYNGVGQVQTYATKLKTAYNSCKTLLNVPRAA
jgi:hypothetical protein